MEDSIKDKKLFIMPKLMTSELLDLKLLNKVEEMPAYKKYFMHDITSHGVRYS